MDKDTFYITRESLQSIFVDADRGVEYLLNKQAIDINPVHVRSLEILKRKPAVASSGND